MLLCGRKRGSCIAGVPVNEQNSQPLLANRAKGWRECRMYSVWHIFFFFSFLKVSRSRVDLQVEIIPAVQQSESVIHIHTSFPSQVLFPHRRSQNIG